ncbi:MAG: 4Fe-4S binding protein [Firmicutes bacterium]|nr:4Fe-4S binding protein [Bacillota bacterium]
MKRNLLGKTGIEVSELCFGSLPFGPLQKNLPVEEAAALLKAAFDKGINFIDTAQTYKTYEHIKLALQGVKERPVISTKSPAKTYEDMQKAVDEALAAMELDYIDIFFIHAARAGVEVFTDREPALRCLLDNKKQGKIKAVGISTHSVKVTSLAADRDEIDVVFPIINIDGMGIIEGTREEMEAAIAKCGRKDKGVVLMKVLAGGTAADRYEEAVNYARSLEGYDSISIGMVSHDELVYNADFFAGKAVGELPEIKDKKITIFDYLCKGCFTCIDTCPNHAISQRGEVAVIDEKACLTCGYCVGACPQFAIRML